ncbi:MAG TPA: CdaR family protein [Candidatus Nitrosotenuis sp.]|nr:CdaR family protein [Candidatus Nitrosotenuis sp.]
MAIVRDWILHNWHLKLLALLIAYLLWSTYTAEPAAEIGYAVPIEFRNVPAQLELDGEPLTQAYVRLRGRSTLLRRLSPHDLSVQVDLARATTGAITMALTAENVQTPYGVSVVRISPSKIHLQLTSKPPR